MEDSFAGSMFPGSGPTAGSASQSREPSPSAVSPPVARASASARGFNVGATASTVAASSAVASTFFASSGFMASTLSAIGLGATAVTPVGWVIAAGVISGGAYVGVSRMFEKSKDSGLVVVPKYINTPLDVIAVALIELMLPVSLPCLGSFPNHSFLSERAN